MKKHLLLIVFSIAVSGVLSAQSWVWAKSAGGAQKVESYSIAIDDWGNSYVTGWFEDSLKFGTDTVLKASIGSNQYASDIFIAKYDRNGSFIWARKVGGNTYDYGNGIATDKLGNVYVTGLFMGTVSFGSHSITSVGDYEIFVAKYDSNGNTLWAQRGGGTGWDVAHGIAVDKDNNCYITGTFWTNATFGSTSLTGAGNYDIYVAKYDTNGTLIWAKNSGGSGDDRAHGISVDALGNSFVTGYYSGTATFGTTTLTSSGGSDIFIAKYDPVGNALWAKKAGGSTNDEGNAIKVMPSADMYVTGYYNGTANFGTTAITSYGNADAFIAKYDYKGDITWVKSYGGSQNDNGYGVAADTFNNIYVAGSFWGTGQFESISQMSINQDDAFIAGIDNMGTTQWVRNGGSLNPDASTAIAASGYGRCYTTGYFNGSASFGTHSISGYSLIDNSLFVAKLDSTFLYDSVPFTDSVPTPPNPIGISSIDIGSKIVVYPNPFTTLLKVDIETMAEIEKVELFDVLGKPVTSMVTITDVQVSPKKRQLFINGEGLTNGIYFIQLSANNQVYTKRIMLNK